MLPRKIVEKSFAVIALEFLENFSEIFMESYFALDSDFFTKYL